MLLITTACITPHANWQPQAGASGTPIYVFGTGRHTVISFPSTASGKPGYEDWAYGEMVWFYEDEFSTVQNLQWILHRIKGVFAALFWPSAGVIEVTHDARMFPDRPDSEFRRAWTFYVSNQNAAALRAWLAASRKPDTPALFEDAGCAYFVSRDRYHVFHTCHHYAAAALRAGGIPVSGWRCVLPWPFWSQLTRLESAQTRTSATPLAK